MKRLPLASLVFLLSVTSSVGQSDGAADAAQPVTACGLLHRKVQDAVPVPGVGFRQRIRGFRSTSHLVRSALREREVGRRCARCILSQVVGGSPASEQWPCGRHDVCLVGHRLSAGADECIESICDHSARCCRRWWSRRCVDAVEEVCDRSCDACRHPECTSGDALRPQCSDCTRQVCAVDPYCCDTAWDLRCVEESRSLCQGRCQLTSTTATVVSSTLATSTTVPICRVDDDCRDDDPCTVDICDREHGCVFEAYACDDADPCTADVCDGVGGCVHAPLDAACDDDACAAQACDPVAVER